MFSPEGYPMIVGAAALAAGTFAAALRLRSWPLWLLGFALIVLALGVAWYIRIPANASVLAPLARS
ncbi:MAG: hypothetical protein IT354_08365 [Gemmatimonadaceae bacterium]|jgi:hypothetical protein|nr:hypothetical protein [Gemmatimonadaceae bacterium]